MVSYPRLPVLIMISALATAEASANDLASPAAFPENASAAYSPSSLFDWSGFYAGVHGGYARSDFSDSAGHRNGFAGGAQIGANAQIGNAVFGGELEGTYLGGGGSNSNSGSDTTIDQEWLFAAKARAGAAFDRTLVYGTVGLAMTKLEAEGPDGSSDHGEWKAGYLIGGGVEQAFTDRVSVRAEYNYLGLAQDYEIGKNNDVDLNNHIVKAGINYRF